MTRIPKSEINVQDALTERYEIPNSNRAQKIDISQARDSGTGVITSCMK